MRHYDQIVIGRGIAGTLLSIELIERGQNVLVIDAKGEGSSTNIAVGMYNPMVFKRLVKTWMADAVLPIAEKKYEEISLGSWQEKGLIRIFNTDQDRTDWLVRSGESGFEEFLLMESDKLIDQSDLMKPFGYGYVPKAGRIDLQAILRAGKDHLVERNALMEERVDHQQIRFEKKEVNVNGLSCSNIIYCEGYQVVKNPLFNTLPFKFAKGEVLTVRMPELDINKTVNRGHFILPMGEGVFKIGSTFDWKDLDEKPTEKGKEWIIERLRRSYAGPVEILDHTAGVRPAVSDRRPILGQHKEESRAWIFNGLGSRGGMLAPYFTKHFCDHFLDSTELNKEVDIQRFY